MAVEHTSLADNNGTAVGALVGALGFATAICFQDEAGLAESLGGGAILVYF